MSVRPASKHKTARPKASGRTVDWRSIAYNTLVSRALDDAEESTNRNRAMIPRENVVLYQFSARGHDVAQTILGSMLDHPHDGVGAYYRSRPLLLSIADYIPMAGGLQVAGPCLERLAAKGRIVDHLDVPHITFPTWSEVAPEAEPGAG